MRRGKAYTCVDQEAVTADGKETDIRLRSVSGYQTTIGLKIGEKGRSARELCDTIDEQLVKKYMAHRDARTGCLLVSVSNPERRGSTPTQVSVSIGLQALLQKKADEAQRRLGGEARILARVLDVVPRLSTEKQAAGTALMTDQASQCRLSIGELPPTQRGGTSGPSHLVTCVS